MPSPPLKAVLSGTWARVGVVHSCGEGTSSHVTAASSATTATSRTPSVMSG
jgi:hypothetical protein